MGPQLGVLIKQLTWRPCLACIRQDNSARYCNMHHRRIYKGMEGLNLGPEGGRNPPQEAATNVCVEFSFTSHERCPSCCYVAVQIITIIIIIIIIIMLYPSLPVGCVWTTRQFVLLWLCASDYRCLRSPFLLLRRKRRCLGSACLCL